MGYHVTIMDVLQIADRVAADAELASVVGQKLNVVCNPVDSAIRFYLILLYYCFFSKLLNFPFRFSWSRWVVEERNYS